MRRPLVYVLVINWNGLGHLRECFDALLAGTYGNTRFLLIDNASSDGSVAFVRSQYGHDGRVEILECGTNLGWAGGNNAGMRRALDAGADYVFLLNNDTATEPDAIEKLVEMAEAKPESGALAPKMLMYGCPDILNSAGLECSIIASSWDRGIGRLDGERWNEPRQVIGVCGGAAFYRGDALRKVGLLPPDFGIYLDDLDLSLRMWNAGYEAWSCPGARVRHKFSATMGAGKNARRKYYLNTRNRARVILRHFPFRHWPRVKLLYAVGEARAIGRAVLDGESWRAWAHVRSWGSAGAYLPRALAWRAKHGAACRFWRLIRQDMMFFGGAPLPEDGWYAPRDVGGEMVRPISRRAVHESTGGPLRVRHVNCYPQLGATRVDVMQHGSRLAALETVGRDEAVIQTAPGPVEFVSARIFEAEETGERIDIGGWIGL